jgi:GTP-binding protein
MSTFSRIAFLTSVGRLEQLPPPDTAEIAFAGRSNVGKSSAINALANRKRLAFVSKTPGRTQTINFFRVDDAARLVDLPGYGFARAPRAMRAGWEQLVGGYLAHRACLKGIVVVMDARHPLTPNDLQLIDWLEAGPRHDRRLLALLSKSDKLSRNDRIATRSAVHARLARAGGLVEVRLFSSLTGEGVDETRELLEQWLLEGRIRPRSRSRNKKPPALGR